MDANTMYWPLRPPFSFHVSAMLKSLLLAVAAFFVSGCRSEPRTVVASVRSIEIKLAEPTVADTLKESIALSGSPGEPIELRCPASLFPLEAGKRATVRLIAEVKGKPVTSAVGVGEIKQSKKGVDELVFALRLPAKPGQHRMEISQDQVLLLKGDFRIVKPAE
jgi:hypothetical protein